MEGSRKAHLLLFSTGSNNNIDSGLCGMQQNLLSLYSDNLLTDILVP